MSALRQGKNGVSRFGWLLALVLSVGIALSATSVPTQAADNTVVVGSKPFTEGYLLSEMMVFMLQAHTDLVIERQFGLTGGTVLLHAAMTSGDVDTYPEYTGTGLLEVLKEPAIFDSEKAYRAVKEGYEEQFQFTWLEPWGFNNTFTLAVKRDFAERHKLESYSDLAALSREMELHFGAEWDFYEREDGYYALVERYGFRFESHEIDIGLKYRAVNQGSVDVINAFSTDGLLESFDMTVLRDDKNFFPPYDAAPVIRQDTLAAHPEIGEVLNRLSGRIDDGAMARLNYLVDETGMQARQVARDWLEEQGLL